MALFKFLFIFTTGMCIREFSYVLLFFHKMTFNIIKKQIVFLLINQLGNPASVHVQNGCLTNQNIRNGYVLVNGI